MPTPAVKSGHDDGHLGSAVEMGQAIGHAADEERSASAAPDASDLPDSSIAAASRDPNDGGLLESRSSKKRKRLLASGEVPTLLRPAEPPQNSLLALLETSGLSTVGVQSNAAKSRPRAPANVPTAPLAAPAPRIALQQGTQRFSFGGGPQTGRRS
jgi:hypothetical protein